MLKYVSMFIILNGFQSVWAGQCQSDMICQNGKYNIATQLSLPAATANSGVCVKAALQLKNSCQFTQPISVVYVDAFRGFSSYVEPGARTDLASIFATINTLILSDD